MPHTIKIKYDSIDVLKFILSFLIIQIHTEFYFIWMKPYVRLAVPIFFIISAFFFFRRNPGKEQLIGYIKRLSILYLFWFIVWGLYFVYANRAIVFSSQGFVFILRSLVFGSTFAASWYIAASIIGTIIVYVLSKLLNDRWLIFITALIYITITLGTSYYHLFPNSFSKLEDAFYQITGTHLSISFPVSLFWIAVGKSLINYNPTKISRLTLSISALASLILLQLEYRFVRNIWLTGDCYLMLIPSCLFLLMYVLSFTDYTCSHAKQLRSASTIIYCSHYNILFITLSILTLIEGKSPNLSSLVKFTIAAGISLIITTIILSLEKIRGFKWLKYSH